MKMKTELLATCCYEDELIENLRNKYYYGIPLSPAGFGTGSSPIWTVPFKGTVDANSVHATLNLRPVLNLIADTQISDGDGTINSPFIVK